MLRMLRKHYSLRALFLGAYGAYFLAKDGTSRGGGLLGAAAYCFAPYILLINPHSRGDLAEVVALGFLPWVLYFWQRLWRQPTKSAALWAIIFSSATLLSHNLTGLSMIAIVGAMAVWQWATGKNRRHSLWVVGTGSLFVLLTAFFWLPFLAERNAVLLNVAGDGHYDFHNHFVSIGELLKFTRRFDYRDATMSVPFSVGPIQVILALLGGIAGIVSRKHQHNFYIAVSAVYLLLNHTFKSAYMGESTWNRVLSVSMAISWTPGGLDHTSCRELWRVSGRTLKL